MQTLLLVDDEPNIVEGLASQFEGRYGGDVIVLKSFSGLHALSILQNNKVDVVLSDIRMPDMDGCNLVRRTEKGRLRRRGWGLRWEKAQKGGKGTNLRGFFED